MEYLEGRQKRATSDPALASAERRLDPGAPCPTARAPRCRGLQIGQPGRRDRGVDLVDLLSDRARWSKDWRSIPYGRPLANQQFHVLDEEMTPCPDWVPGQLYIGGDRARARATGGTRPRPERASSRIRRRGERLYRTGDLGRYLPDGDIEFLGREDDQVKVQGYRIELGEIEATLERHPKVKSAVVTAVGERAAAKHLVAYVVTDAANVEELAEYLRQNLPEYMVPAVWQELDALPLTTNGKVNRKALPSVARPQSIQARPAEPQPDALTRISALIAQELALPSVDPAKNLLTLGATSMDLVRIVGRLQKELSFRPSFQEFLRDPSAAALADRYQKSNAVATKAGAPAPHRRNAIST